MDKQQAQNLINATFENPFDKDRFNGFIKNLLNQVEESIFTYQGNYIPDAYKPYISSLERLYKYSDGEHKVDILVVQLKKKTSLERARTMQRNFIAWYLNGSRGGEMKDAALVAFVSPGEADWRFSLVKMDYRFEEGKNGKVKVKEDFTPARRWSFLVGSNEASHTAQSRLVNVLADDEHNPTLQQLEEAFNIETVTKEFFLKYRELFIRTKEELDKVVERDARVKADFEAKGVDTVNFAKKLLGQIVFLYFLQKKGWFGVERDAEWGTGSKYFLRELFKGKHGRYNNFFNDILEPLFYEALRIDRSYDDHYYSRFDCKIPFLNGGLFNPIGNYDWVHTDINIPNELFSNTVKTKEGDIGNGILDIFDRYNFTVREDEPLEKEVAIDPELLGKAYEKFNAIRPDNFEEYKTVLKSGQNGAENKFNKKFGVYYTPREIVHYMCKQSLINYLFTRAEEAGLSNDIKKQDIEDLIEVGEMLTEHEATAFIKQEKIKNGIQKSTEYVGLLSDSIRKYAETIDNWLAEIRVCDPAVGSGAFPVGMMHEIVRARNVLSAFLNDTKRNNYEFKRRCIEHSLYGVDIDPGAVEIAKLRLWLSLVVDEDDISQIKPLPNLDYKIVCGNSLLGYPYRPRGLETIEILKEQFFNETRPNEKYELRQKIDEAIYSLYTDTEKSLGYKVNFDFTINFSEVFHKKGGFDVVVANPPYIGEKGHKEIFREVKKGALGKFYLGKMDYFYFFFHASLNIGKGKAVIAFITTNYYPTATGGKKLRQGFKERAIVKNLINFNELKIFESALGQHNMITFLQKGYDETSLAQTCITQRQGLATAEVLQQILNSNDSETQYYKVAQKDLYDGDECYIRLAGVADASDNPIQKILNKIKSQGVNLGSVCNINQGIVTGADKVSKKHIEKYKIRAEVGDGIFVLSEKEISNLNLNNKEKEILKPWFKNSDIFRWKTIILTDESILYLDRKRKAFDENIKKYLKIYQDILKERREVKNNVIQWWQLQWPREESIFQGSKIVAPQRSPRNTFAYNEIPWYASADVYFITEKDKTISLKYVLAILNSSLYYLWLYHRGKRKGESLELYQKPLSEIPIKKISENEQKPFIENVNEILSITKSDDYLTKPSKQAKVKEYERKIDQMVYKLYGLSEEEIRIVEESKP